MELLTIFKSSVIIKKFLNSFSNNLFVINGSKKKNYDEPR